MAVIQGNLNLSLGTNVVSILLIRATLSLSFGSSLNSLVTSYALFNIPLGMQQSYRSRFARFFGVNATQDINNVYIKKSDLSLTELSNNTAESILVALLLYIAKYESNLIISNVYIYLFKQYINTDMQPKLISNLVVHLFKEITYATNESEILNNLMVDYTTVVTPNEFNI